MDCDQRGDFLTWTQERFAQGPSEQARDDLNRDKGKSETEVKQARRSRFNLEKQRSAGSSQIWGLLSFSGRVSE